MTPEHSRTDASLVRVSATDPAAFSELYARHVDTVYRWFRRRIDWAASDLTAETFARAWLARGRFRDERNGSALPWLLGIAANVLADTVRRDRVETRARERLGLPLDLAREDGYAEIEERLSPRLALERSLDSLPDHERRVVELRNPRRASVPARRQVARDPPGRRPPPRVPRPPSPRALHPEGGPVNNALPASLTDYRAALEDAIRRDVIR